ncbi:hypothetical protein EOM09_06505, partial [bacterium]|nr:hypothetical protein [bacterium]
MFSKSFSIFVFNKSKLSLCANFGNVSATTYYAGGIVGRNYNTTIISGCYNSGEISTAAFNAGGIVGLSAYGILTVNDCYNTGTITSVSGGIVGKSDVTTNINNCYNVGIANQYIYVT